MRFVASLNNRLALTEIERLKKSHVGTAGVLIPVLTRLSRLAEKPGSLIDRLEAVLQEEAQLKGITIFTDLWPLMARKVEQGQALLLLDGWDEVRIGKDELKIALQAFVQKHTNYRLYLTSRIAGYETLTIGAQEWELASFTTEQVETFVKAFFGLLYVEREKSRRAQQSEALVRNLKDNLQVMGLARIPLMLSLLCRLCWENQQISRRRVDIYRDCLWGLVFKWKYGSITSVVHENEANDTLDLLAELSLSLFLDSPHLDAWSLRELKEHIKGLPDGLVSNAERVDRIDQLIKDGVLVREGEDERSPLRFIHRTFQEYLVATAVANRANVRRGQAENFKIDVALIVQGRFSDGR